MAFRRVIYETGKSLRETGQALDRFALRLTYETSFMEKFSRHRQIMNLYDQHPSLGPGLWIAPSASVIGDVMIGESSSIFYGCVLRGDLNRIVVGPYTNIQDRTVITTVAETTNGQPASTYIGGFCTIGHSVALESCTINDECEIGMGSTIMEGAVVGRRSMVAAGSVVPAGAYIPPGQLWGGNPATFIRNLTTREQNEFMGNAESLERVGALHSDEFQEYGAAYLDAERVVASQE